MRWNQIKSLPVIELICRFFMKNAPSKIVALIMTALLFLVAKQRKTPNQEIKDIPNVPVEINVSARKRLLNKQDWVSLKVKMAWYKKEVPLEDVQIRINGDNAKWLKGKTYEVPIIPANVTLPRGVEFVSTDPTRIQFDMDNLTTKIIDINPVFEGTLPPGYTRGAVTIEPSRVTVEATSSTLKSLKSFNTFPIPLKDINRTFDIETGIDTGDLDIKLNTRMIKVHTEIIYTQEHRTFQSLPVRIQTTQPKGNRPLICRIQSSPNVSMEVSGSAKIIRSLRKEEVFPYIDVSKIDKPGFYSMDVQGASNRPDVNITNITPKRIDIRIEQK